MAQITESEWHAAIKLNLKLAAVRNDRMQYLKIANDHDADGETEAGKAALAVYDALVAYQAVLNKSFGK